MLVQLEQVVMASDKSSKMTPVKNQATKEQSPKKAGEKSPVANKAMKMLSPTESKVRVFFSDTAKDANGKPEVEGVEVIVCKGKCNGRTSMPYTKGLEKIQAKAERAAMEAVKNDPDYGKLLGA